VGFGPRLTVSVERCAAQGWCSPAALITWVYRLLLPQGANNASRMGEVRAEALERFPEAGWNIRARTNASPGPDAQHRTVLAVSDAGRPDALVVGGVGRGDAAASFVDLKRPAIAYPECLGAAGRDRVLHLPSCQHHASFGTWASPIGPGS
jgi:putative ABC transport system permease protein